MGVEGCVLGVEGLDFGVWVRSLWFGFCGSGFVVWGLGLDVLGLECSV